MARIAIIGPGAIGGVVAAWLTKTGAHDVILCARRPLPELVVETPEGELVSYPRVIVAPEDGTPVDWVLIATKAYDAAGAAAWFPSLLRDEETPVAVLQNGVEHRERFAAWLAPQQIVPVIVDFPAERVTPTRIRQRAAAPMTVANDPHGRAFAALFSGTSMTVKLSNDLKTVAWRKLCLNAVGVLSALVLKPAGVMQDAELAETGRQLARECIAVGRAEGAALEDSVADDVVRQFQRAPADSINSLHADRLAQRPLEIDARNGVIVRLGRKHGIPTPCNQMAVALLETMTRT